ncbi:isoaspartyl peptidase/L-asparaginase family protein [Brevundimonas sp. VNH65]|uniref:isoaspartyl peptidase/L-asparaginase family protein n=1 Tax=Brevundimonas sp. VNH65 TaxID=3400917 RepID=UPI003C078CFA
MTSSRYARLRRALTAASGLVVLGLSPQAFAAAESPAQTATRWSLAIHGGAGTIERDRMTPAQDAAYRQALEKALEAGSAVLAGGGSALDAVQAAVEIMEDDPLFNAGRGAVFTAAGRNELDAAVMDGSHRAAGAVAGLTTTRHPIAAARAVMEKSPHVFLIGQGAETFAAEQGLEQVAPAFFFTERRWQGLVAGLRQRGLPVPDRPEGAPPPPVVPMADHDPSAPPLNEKKFGTVGAVALDSQGRLAAATSTGGMSAKQWGRVGDVPVIGAGTYASNADGCAVSATGDGEYFIRATVARDICARMAAYVAPTPEQVREAEREICAEPHPICQVRPRSPQATAAEAEIADAANLGGTGGVIVMALDGRPAFAMSTSGMYRGAVSSDQPEPRVAIYADEPGL